MVMTQAVPTMPHPGSPTPWPDECAATSVCTQSSSLPSTISAAKVSRPLPTGNWGSLFQWLVLLHTWHVDLAFHARVGKDAAAAAATKPPPCFTDNFKRFGNLRKAEGGALEGCGVFRWPRGPHPGGRRGRCRPGGRPRA